MKNLIALAATRYAMAEYSTPILQPRGSAGNPALFCCWSLVAVLFLAPALWMISSSLKPDYEIFATPPTLVAEPAALAELSPRR